MPGGKALRVQESVDTRIEADVMELGPPHIQKLGVAN